MKATKIYHLISILILLLATSLSATASSARAPVPNLAGSTERVSVATDGTQGNKDSGWGLFEDYKQQDISSNGRYVTFYSEADNLVNGDTNGVADIFVRDRLTGETTRVSVSSTGAEGNAKSTVPSLSADGRYVAFESEANNLVLDDTNGEVDIFTHDRDTGVTSRVSISSDEEQGNGWSYSTSISGDGRYVAFASFSANLVGGDTNELDDIFVRDRVLGETTRVSVTSNAEQANSWSYFPSISADGDYVAFISLADNLVDGDTNQERDVFVHDRLAGETMRVSVATDGAQGNGMVDSCSISKDGHFVVFASIADNLVDGDTNATWDVFLYETSTGETRRISLASDGTQANDWSLSSVVSSDGRYVAFVSFASNLVYADTNGRNDIFVYDWYTGRIIRVSIASDGAQAVGNCDSPAISLNGQFTSFVTYAGNLVEDDTNGFSDVFVRDEGELSLILLPFINR